MSNGDIKERTVKELTSALGPDVEKREMKWDKYIGFNLLNPSRIIEVVKVLKKLGYAQPVLITGVDRPSEGAIELVYKFNRIDSGVMTWIYTKVDRENPRIPSITPLWRAAFPHEIETYDLLGVVFENIPDLRHVFLPWDWNQGFPLRKDWDPNEAKKYPWWEKTRTFYQPFIIPAEEADDIYYVSLGPQHPAVHGSFRLILKLRGDTILEAWPDFGWVHRGIEKLAEGKTFDQIIVYTDRLCYASSLTWNLTYSLAAEDLLGVEVPERALWFRVILAEMQRIVSHLLWLAALSADLGTFHSMFLYPIREREKFLDLFEKASGARLTYSYIKIGGVGIFKHVENVPDSWFNELKEVLSDFRKKLKEYLDMTEASESFYIRTRNIGILRGRAAIEAGATGPVLRAAGIKYDVRKVDPYLVYDQLDFEIPVGKRGDVYDRWWVRINEMLQSIRIIEQAVEDMPKQGPLRVKVPPAKMRGKGEGIGRTEDPRGEAIIYIVGDGKNTPYRIHIRSPTYINLSLLHFILRKAKFADIAAIIGSLDPCMAEVDR